MGNYRIAIEAVGGHGCQREIKDGGKVLGCGLLDCPDCLTRAFLSNLKTSNSLVSATLTHWPGEKSEVVDDLITNVRKGSF